MRVLCLFVAVQYLLRKYYYVNFVYEIRCVVEHGNSVPDLQLPSVMTAILPLFQSGRLLEQLPRRAWLNIKPGRRGDCQIEPASLQESDRWPWGISDS